MEGTQTITDTANQELKARKNFQELVDNFRLVNISESTARKLNLIAGVDFTEIPARAQL
ncbi:MAG: hypothetical protein V1810_01470 [Candidatus Beckwithbacteria bacterium]